MVDNPKQPVVDNRATKTPVERIRELLRRTGSSSGAALAARLGLSRQAVHKHLKKMAANGEVLQSGATRGASYRLLKAGQKPAARQLKLTFRLKGLEEDRVFEECALWLNLRRELTEPAYDIVKYAFSEMLNNAIDHSESTECAVAWMLGPHDVRFSIRDFGIGLFHSIESKLRLGSETEALGELIKGKTTTMKQRHSGEGIFFTSRAGDLISFESHRIQLVFDNRKKDVLVTQRKLLKGTNVRFEISRRSRKNLGAIFSEYAPEQYAFRFEKTRVRVELLHTDFVSRSEARRLLRGLKKFQEVILDFRKVKSIGQAFADELFRVFPSQHPSTTIRAENATPAVDIMIRHVQTRSAPARQPEK